jgi:hypothetical protein
MIVRKWAKQAENENKRKEDERIDKHDLLRSARRLGRESQRMKRKCGLPRTSELMSTTACRPRHHCNDMGIKD